MARLLLDAAVGGASVPVFVVIPAPGSTPVKTLDLRPFARLAPDVPAYYIWSTDHLDRVAFADGAVRRVETPEPPTPVVLLRSGERITAVQPGTVSALIEAPETVDVPVDIYNPQSGAFETLPVMPTLADTRYAAGLRLQLDSQTLRLNPATIDLHLPELVSRSRAANTLCPFTSFMVVENSAQEQTLATRQKQALGANHALEFEETVKSPEPNAIWLLPVVLLLAWRLRRSRKNA